MAVSVAMTPVMGVAPSWQVMAGLVAIHGLAQATGWSGNVGAKVEHGLGPVFAMLFASAVLATMFCAALVWRNRHGKGI